MDTSFGGTDQVFGLFLSQPMDTSFGGTDRGFLLFVY